MLGSVFLIHLVDFLGKESEYMTIALSKVWHLGELEDIFDAGKCEFVICVCVDMGSFAQAPSPLAFDFGQISHTKR